MSRGELSWLITLTEDGGLPLGGAAPAVIQWQVEPHPARRLADSGCSLLELQVHHPEPPEVKAIFASIGLAAAPEVRRSGAGSRPLLVAHIQTPNGLRLLAAP